jgi:hypothetical protein
VFEKVVTSNRGLAPGQMHVDTVLDSLSQVARLQARLRLAGSGLQSGLGAWIVISGVHGSHAQLQLLKGDPVAESAWLRLAQHGQESLGGAVLLASGNLKLAAAVSERTSRALAANGSIAALARWGGASGLAIVVASDIWAIEQYRRGHLGREEFWTSQADFAGGVTGVMLGGWAGAKAGAVAGGAIGALFGPEGVPLGAGIGAFVGAVGGGLGGGYLGSTLATYPVEAFYQFRSDEVQTGFEAFLYSHYGLPASRVGM